MVLLRASAPASAPLQGILVRSRGLVGIDFCEPSRRRAPKCFCNKVGTIQVDARGCFNALSTWPRRCWFRWTLLSRHATLVRTSVPHDSVPAWHNPKLGIMCDLVQNQKLSILHGEATTQSPVADPLPPSPTHPDTSGEGQSQDAVAAACIFQIFDIRGPAGLCCLPGTVLSRACALTGFELRTGISHP
jgi:hypothetical protein